MITPWHGVHADVRDDHVLVSVGYMGPALLVTREEWRVFLVAARNGDFDCEPVSS